MRRTTPLLAVTLLGLALLAPATASATAETCRGEVATIVGTSPTLTGTEGRDVIVTGSSSDVFGLGGDDLICVRGSGRSSNLLEVDAGAANDTVDTTGMGSSYYITVDLGEGADTFVGGAPNDTVTTGNAEQVGIDGDVDTVRTGEGDDRVTFGARGVEIQDVVDLGPGADRATLATFRMAPEGVLAGGDGEDRLLVDRGGVSIDMAAGHIQARGNPDYNDDIGRFSSFEEAELTMDSSELSYRGTSADDLLIVHLEPNCCTLPGLTVDTYGGDDQVLIDNTSMDDSSRIDMGRGEDQLEATRATGSLALDLKLDRLTTSDPRYPDDGEPGAVGIENAFLMAPEVVMIGDNQDNNLSFNGCEATLRGGHGDDYLTNVAGDPRFDTYTFDCEASANMYGGPGKDRLRGGAGRDMLLGEGDRDRIEGRGDNDRIRGGQGADVLDGGDGRDDVRGQQGNDVLRGRASADKLVGGRGRDTADGSAGRDRCGAERERRCER